jgi:exopolyphosphatase/guanosine-5'-triphosphate,3'-diphosphate pyrophosphatase
MKIAAIDIGSNAVRLQITKILEYHNLITFKKLEYIRFPLRLGHDVFTMGKIGADRKIKFLKLIEVFKTLIDLYEIDHYYACATSAMREATNGEDLTQLIKEKLNLQIDIISGEKEAEMINKVVELYLDDRSYLHIDVGGGSTELNLYVNKKKVACKSFPIGSVRTLRLGDYTSNWRALIEWLNKQIKSSYGKITAIGTGGNIVKIYELSEGDKRRKISLRTVMKVQDFLKNMSLEERMLGLQLNPDRADVIIPATDIYIEVMKAARAKSIFIPDVGLKDGINFYLYETYYPNKGKVLVRN